MPEDFMRVYGIRHAYVRRSGMALRPLHDRLLVKRLEEKEQVVGSIIIPDTAKEKPQEAKVLAVGPGRVTDDGKVQPIDVKVGDTADFGKYSGTQVKMSG